MGMQQAATGSAEQDIDPDTLKRLLAAYQANPSLRVAQGEGESGVTYAGDPAATVNGYTIAVDPNTGKPIISKGLSHKTWGQDKAAVYGTDGKFQGYSSGDSEALSLGKFAALSAGAYYGAGALNGMTGAAGAAGTAASGAATSASEQIAMLAANGMSDAAIAEAFPALAEAGGLTGVGGGAATAAASEGASNFRPSQNYGEGLTGNQTTVYDKAIDLTGSPGIANVAASNSTVADGLVNAGDVVSNLSDANSVKNATDAGSKGMNWLDVVNTAATVYGITKAGDASSDATDAAKTVADRQLDLNEESLNWFKQVYADQAPDRTAAAQRANAISDAQLRGMTFATDQAQELDQYNKTTFRPVEQRLVADAQGYDTEGRRESAAQEASGRVASEFDTTRQSAGREMIRYGVDPSTIAALDASSQIDEAKARAGAGNTARTNVEQQGWSRMADVANMGRGIASQQATQQGIATTTGNSSVANSNSALANTQSGNGLMAQGFQNANQGNQIAGSMFNNLANTQRQDDQMLLNGISGVTNYLGNRYGTSDPKVKKGTGRMANAAQALKEVEATPVHDGWEYDESKGAPPGSGGKKMTGPMATDVQRISGEASAPGGKQIDLVKQQGRMMAAIQKLAKDVRSLKKHETEPEKEAA